MFATDALQHTPVKIYVHGIEKTTFSLMSPSPPKENLFSDLRND